MDVPVEIHLQTACAMMLCSSEAIPPPATLGPCHSPFRFESANRHCKHDGSNIACQIDHATREKGASRGQRQAVRYGRIHNYARYMFVTPRGNKDLKEAYLKAGRELPAGGARAV